MSDRFQIKKNTITAGVSFFLNIGLVFISFRVLIAAGGVEAVGVWASVVAFASVMRFGDVGMANASVRYVARHDLDTQGDEVRRIIETGFLSNMLIYGALSLISYFVLDYALPFVFKDESNLTPALQVLPYLVASLFISNSANCILGFLTGLHKGYIAHYLRMAGNLVQIILVLILVPKYGLIGMAVAQALQYALLALVAWALVYRAAALPSPIPKHIDRPVFREMFGFSISAQIASASGGLFEPFSKILLSLFVGVEFVGYYELAYKTAWLPRNAIVSALNAGLPAMTFQFKNDGAAFDRIYGKFSKNALLSGGLVLGTVALFAPIPSYLWLGEVNFTYWQIVVILSLAFAITVWTAPAVMLAHVIGMFRSNTIISAGTSLGMLGFGYMLGEWLGASETSFVILFGVTVATSNILMKRYNEQACARVRTQ